MKLSVQNSSAALMQSAWSMTPLAYNGMLIHWGRSSNYSGTHIVTLPKAPLTCL